MYSIVLMMALSNSAATPSYQDVLAAPEEARKGQELYRGRRGRRCCGCNGGYNGCYGCNGCYGGGYGCHGGGYGCHGGGWRGGYGCYGGGCSGGYVGCYGGTYTASHGGTYHGYSSGYQGMPYSQPAPAQTPPSSQGSLGARARIVVQLPADAKLTVDDTATQATSAVRTFISPPLEPGKSYYYTLKAEINRDGRTLSTDQRVTVRAGEQANVKLEFPVASVAQR